MTDLSSKIFCDANIVILDYSKCGEGYVGNRSKGGKNKWPWAVAVYVLHNSHCKYT